MDKYTKALQRLHMTAGAVAGSLFTWFVGELKNVDSFTGVAVVFIVVTVICWVDAWRTRK